MTAFYLRGTIFNVLHRKVPGTYAQRLFSGYQQTFSGNIAQGNPTHITVIGRFLSTYIRMELFPNRSIIQAYQCSCLSVCIVFLRTASQPGHHFIFCRKYHTHTQTRHFMQRLFARGEVHAHPDGTVRMNIIDCLQCRALRLHLISNRYNDNLLFLRNFQILQFSILSGSLPGGAAIEMSIRNIVVRQRTPEVGL